MTGPDSASEINEQAYAVLRDDLLAYASYTMPRYRPSAHHVRLARKLEAVERGELTRLRSHMPPRRGKTELAIVRFASWHLGKHPDLPIICVSYGDLPVTRFSRLTRAVMESPEYQKVFPNIKLNQSSRAAGMWEIAGHDGYFMATSIGGAAAGFGAHGVIIDDPHKGRAEAESEIERERAWDFYASLAYNRLTPEGWIIVQHTRWHDDDLSGRLDELEKNGGDRWDKVIEPAFDDAEISVETLFESWKDDPQGFDDRFSHVRRCWPERYKLSSYIQAYANNGPREWESQFMCRPRAPEGNLFKKQWFVMSGRAPEDLEWIRMWDIAVSEKDSACRTAGVKMAVDSLKQLWIEDVVVGRWNWPEARRRILQTAEQDGTKVRVFAERPAYGGKIAGINVARDLVDNWERIDIPFRLVDPVGDVSVACNPVAARAECGRVILVRGPWNDDFISEVCSIPNGKFNDQGAALGLGFRQLSASALGPTSEDLPPKQFSPAWFRQMEAYEQQADQQIIYTE